MQHTMTYTTIHAVKFLLFISVLAVSYILLVPTHAHAYYTTGQHGVRLEGGSALFLIDFAFGMNEKTVQIPARADFSPETVSGEALAYTIYDEDENEAVGNASAMVLSHAPIAANGSYIAPKGSVTAFTLAVVFTPTVTTKVNEYRMQVTHLPFNFNGTQPLQLNPSELARYTTKLISL